MPGWDEPDAPTIFEQMLVKTSNKIDGVAAANDGLANAVVVALKTHGLKPIPLSGQDAIVAGRAEHHLRLADMTVSRTSASSRVVAANAAVDAPARQAGRRHVGRQDEGPRQRRRRS